MHERSAERLKGELRGIDCTLTNSKYVNDVFVWFVTALHNKRSQELTALNGFLTPLYKQVDIHDVARCLSIVRTIFDCSITRSPHHLFPRTHTCVCVCVTRSTLVISSRIDQSNFQWLGSFEPQLGLETRLLVFDTDNPISQIRQRLPWRSVKIREESSAWKTFLLCQRFPICFASLAFVLNPLSI